MMAKKLEQQYQEDDLETTLKPHVTSVAEFRNQVREQGKTLKTSDILKLCDELHADILPNLSVRLEDRECVAFAVKLLDKANRTPRKEGA